MYEDAPQCHKSIRPWLTNRRNQPPACIVDMPQRVHHRHYLVASQSPRGAVEGDVRLVNETSIANWQVGRLEVFFEGSWSQVCRGAFDGADADVACRQLGYGAGTVSVVPGMPASADEHRVVFPEVAITLPACRGMEADLLQCGGEAIERLETIDRGCYNAFGQGLMLACVESSVTGMFSSYRVCTHMVFVVEEIYSWKGCTVFSAAAVERHHQSLCFSPWIQKSSDVHLVCFRTRHKKL